MRDAPRNSSISASASSCFPWLKLVIDRFVGGTALICATPLLLWLGYRIRRDSPGPAIFRQTRAGLRGRPFVVLKFRTMRTDADPYGDSPQSDADPRLTRLGRWLRETSLDELPQLINVLRGEMSLVGPRPLYVQQIAEWDERQRMRLRVKPGLTGLAQINGRGAITIEEKLEWDVRYVESASLSLDLRILWRTLRGLRGGGIYEVRYSSKLARRRDAKQRTSNQG